MNQISLSQYLQLPKYSGIYIIKNIQNGYIYLGSTKNLRNRIYQHQFTLKKQKHRNIKLQNAYNKYGKSSFIVIVLACVLDLSKLIEVEQYFLDTEKPYINGYNICSIAQSTLGLKLSLEAKAKISKATKGDKNPFYGMKHSKEVKQHLSNLSKNRYCGENNPFYNKKHTVLTREKMRASKRNIRFKCLETNEEFMSTGDAARKYNIHIRDVSNCVYGRQRSTKGYTFVRLL